MYFVNFRQIINIVQWFTFDLMNACKSVTVMFVLNSFISPLQQNASFFFRVTGQ